MANTPKYTMNAVDSHRWIKPTMPDGLNLSVGENSNCKDETCATGYCFHGDCPSVVRPFYALAEDGGAYLTTHDGVIYYLAPGSTKMKMIYPENRLVSMNVKAAPYDSTGASLSAGGSAVRFEFNITDADFQAVVRPSLNRIIPWRPGSTTCMVRVGTDYTGTDSVVFSGRSEYARMSTPKGNGGNIKGGLTQPFSNGYYCVQTDHNRCVVFYKDNIIYQGRYNGMGTPTPFYYALSCCTAGSCCPKRQTSISWDYNIFPKWKLNTNGSYKVSTTLDKYVSQLSADTNGLFPNVVKRNENAGVFTGYQPVSGYCLYDLNAPVVIANTTYNYSVYDISDNKVVGYAVVSEDGDTKGEIKSITTRLKTGDNEVDNGALKRSLESRFVGQRVAWSIRRGEIACYLKDDEKTCTPDYDCEYEGVFRCEYNEETTSCNENERGGAPGRIFWYQGSGYSENDPHADLWISRWREEMCVSCDTSEGNSCECNLGQGRQENIYTTDNNCKYQHPDTSRICGKCNYPVTLDEEEPVWKHRQDCSARNRNRPAGDHTTYKDTWVCKAALAKARLAHLGGRIESIYYGDGSESDWAYISVGNASCRTNKDYTVIGEVDGRKGPDNDKTYLPGYFYDAETETYTFSPSAADAVVLRAPATYSGDFIKTRSVGFPKGDAYTIQRVVVRDEGDETDADPQQLHSLIVEKLDGFYTDCSDTEPTQTEVKWEEKTQETTIWIEETWIDKNGNEKKHTNTKTVEIRETGKYNTVFAKTYIREKDTDSSVTFKPQWIRGEAGYLTCPQNWTYRSSGYGMDAVVVFNGKLYRSKKDSNTASPESRPVDWEEIVANLSDIGDDFDISDNTYIESIILTHDYDNLPDSTVSFELKEWENDGETEDSGVKIKRSKITGVTTVEMVDPNVYGSDNTRKTVSTTIKITKTLSVPQVWKPYTEPTNGPDVNDPYKEYDPDADVKAFIDSAYVDSFGESNIVITEDATVTRITSEITEVVDTEPHSGNHTYTEEENGKIDPVEVRRRFMRFFPAYATRPDYIPPLNDGAKNLDVEWETSVDTKGCPTTKGYPSSSDRTCSKAVVSEVLGVDDGFYRVGEPDRNPPNEVDDHWRFIGFVNEPIGSSHWFAKWVYTDDTKSETTEPEDGISDEDTSTEQDNEHGQSEEVLVELPRPDGVCDEHTYTILDDIASPEGGKWYCLGPSASESRGFENYGGGEEGDTEAYDSSAGIKWVQAVFVWGDPAGTAIRGGTIVGDIYYKLGKTTSQTQDSSDSQEPHADVEFEELVEGSDRYWYWNGYEWLDGGAYFSDINGEKVIFYKDKGKLDIGVADFEEEDSADGESSDDGKAPDKTIEGREEKESCEYSKAVFVGKVRNTQACGDLLAVNLNAPKEYHSAVFYKEKPVWDRPAFSAEVYPEQHEMLRCLGASYTVLVYNTGENRQRLCVWYHPYGVETLAPKTTYAAEFSYDAIPDISLVKDMPVSPAMIQEYGAEKTVKKYLVAVSRDRMKLYVFYEGKLKKTYTYPDDFVSEKDIQQAYLNTDINDPDEWLIRHGYSSKEDFYFSGRPDLEGYFGGIRRWMSLVCGPRYCSIKKKSYLSDNDCISLANLSTEVDARVYTDYTGTCNIYDIWVDGSLALVNRTCTEWLNGAFVEFLSFSGDLPATFKTTSDMLWCATTLLCVASGQSFLLSTGKTASVASLSIKEKCGLPITFAERENLCSADYSAGGTWNVGGATIPIITGAGKANKKKLVESVFLLSDADGGDNLAMSIPPCHSVWSKGTTTVSRGVVVYEEGNGFYQSVSEGTLRHGDMPSDNVNGWAKIERSSGDAEADTFDSSRSYSEGDIVKWGASYYKAYGTPGDGDAPWSSSAVFAKVAGDGYAPATIDMTYHILQFNHVTENSSLKKVNLTPRAWREEAEQAAWANAMHSYIRFTNSFRGATPFVRQMTNAMAQPHMASLGLHVGTKLDNGSTEWVLYVDVLEADSGTGSPVAIVVYYPLLKSYKIIDVSDTLPTTSRVSGGDPYQKWISAKLISDHGYSGNQSVDEETLANYDDSIYGTLWGRAVIFPQRFTPNAGSLILEWASGDAVGKRPIMLEEQTVGFDNYGHLRWFQSHIFSCILKVTDTSYWYATGKLSPGNGVGDDFLETKDNYKPTLGCFLGSNETFIPYSVDYPNYMHASFVEFAEASRVAALCGGYPSAETADSIFIAVGPLSTLYEIGVDGTISEGSSESDLPIYNNSGLGCPRDNSKTYQYSVYKAGSSDTGYPTYNEGDIVRVRRYGDSGVVSQQLYRCLRTHTRGVGVPGPGTDSSGHPVANTYWEPCDDSYYVDVFDCIPSLPQHPLCSDEKQICGNYIATGVVTTETSSYLSEEASQRIEELGGAAHVPAAAYMTYTSITTVEWEITHPAGTLPIKLKKETTTINDRYKGTNETSKSWSKKLDGTWNVLGDIDADTVDKPILQCCRSVANRTLGNYVILIDGSVWYRNRHVTDIVGSYDNIRQIDMSCCGDGVLLKDLEHKKALFLIDGVAVYPFTSGTNSHEPVWRDDIGYHIEYCCGYDYYLLKAAPISALDPDPIYGRDCDPDEDSCPDWVEEQTNSPYEKRFVTRIRDDATRTLDDGSVAHVVETATVNTSYTVKNDGSPDTTVYRDYEYPVKWKTETAVDGETVEIEFLDDTDYKAVANAEYKQDLDPESVVEKKTVRYVPWRRPVMMRDSNTYVYYKTNLISTDPRINGIACFRYKNIYADDKARMPEYHATAAYAVFYDNPADSTDRMRDTFRITKPSNSEGSDGSIASSSVYYYKGRWEGTAVQNILGVKNVDSEYDAENRILYDSASVQVDDTSTCCDHAVDGTTESEKNTFCATKGKIKESQKNTCIIVWSRATCQTRTRYKDGSTVMNFHNNDKPFVPYWDGKPYKSDSPDYATYGKLDDLVVDEVYSTGGSDPRSAIEKLRDDVLYINDYNAAGRWDRVSGDDPVDDWISDDNSFQSNQNCAGVGGLFTSAPAYHTQQDPDNAQLDEFGRLIVSGNNTLYVFDDILGRHDYNIQTGEKLSYKKQNN